MTVQDDPLIGSEVDGYRIEKLLGKGGMARVYRAQDIRLGRYAAIKVIEPDARQDPEYTRRFENEARAVAGLQHPHIVSIYRFGEVGDLYYMAMQYIEGADVGWVLTGYAQKKELMPHEDVLRIVTHVAGALDYAHSKGVIHRDFKPSNVMLDNEGKAILTDFGLALVQMQGTRGEIFGTPHYIAPEQAVSSAGAVPASDQYSLGVMLYEMLTGSLPFDDGSAMSIALAHMTEPLPSPLERNPDLNPAFVEVLEKVLQKEPEMRYSNCAVLAKDLERVMKAQRRQPSQPARISMLSVSEQVKEFRAAHPLPPLPAPVITTPPPPRASTTASASPAVATQPASPAVPTQPASPAPPTVQRLPEQRPIWAWVAAGSALVVIAGIAVILLLMSLRGSGSSTTPTAPAASVLPSEMPSVAAILPTFTISAEAPTATLTLTWTPEPPTPIPTEPTAIPATPVPVVAASPTQGSTTYTLTVIRKGEDSLFVVNHTTSVFPVSPLQVGDDDGVILGSEWGIASLNTNECVTAWKDSGNPKAPDVSCNQVGAQITREGKSRFWKESFGVFYNGMFVRTCEKDETESGCTLSITVP